MLGDKEVTYTLHRSTKRKTIGVQIHFEHGLVVRVPSKLKIQFIEKFLKRKQKWIINKMDVVQRNTPDKVIRDFSQGEKLLFLGSEYEITHIPISGKRIKVNIVKNVFEICHPEDFNFQLNGIKIKNMIKKWYKQEAEKVINERISFYKNKLSVKPLGIKIRSYKSRWGACRENGQITFNWKLVQAPIPIIDYVVVHELSHLVHLNHSKEYWDLVQKHSPDYIAHKNWLKNNILYLRFD